MPFASVRQFSPLCRQRVRIAQYTGYDSYGQPAWGADTTYQAAVIGEMKLVRDFHGQQVPSRQTVYLMAALAMQPNDRITLSTEDVDSTEDFALKPPIVSVGRYPFLRGQYFTAVYLG